MRTTLFLALLLSLLACGDSQDSAIESDPPTTPADATAIALEQTAELQKDHDRKTLDKATIKGLLPESLMGISRTKHNANAVKAGGFDMATAEATYQQDGKRIKIVIADGVGMATMGVGTGLTDFEMDSEEGDQRKYTTEIDGKKAVVDYNKRARRGSLTLIYPQSTVTIDANEIDGEADLKKILAELDLSIL